MPTAFTRRYALLNVLATARRVYRKRKGTFQPHKPKDNRDKVPKVLGLPAHPCTLLLDKQLRSYAPACVTSVAI